MRPSAGTRKGVPFSRYVPICGSLKRDGIQTVDRIDQMRQGHVSDENALSHRIDGAENPSIVAFPEQIYGLEVIEQGIR